MQGLAPRADGDERRQMEYCYILNSTNEKFYMEQTHKKLTGIDKILLKRDSISYYPADIFINNRWFKSLKKW